MIRLGNECTVKKRCVQCIQLIKMQKLYVLYKVLKNGLFFQNMRCGIDMKIFKPEEYSQSRYLNYIQSAVYAISHAIQNAIVTKCNGNASQECIYQVINRKDILQHLRDVTFNGKCNRLKIQLPMNEIVPSFRYRFNRTAFRIC